MATLIRDFTHNQGDTFRFHATWLDKNKDPIDLTSRTARMQLRTSPDSVDIVIELTTENGRITLGDAEGTIDLLISAADTAALAAGTYKYDLEIVTGNDDDVVKLLRGKFKIVAEVTK